MVDAVGVVHEEEEPVSLVAERGLLEARRAERGLVESHRVHEAFAEYAVGDDADVLATLEQVDAIHTARRKEEAHGTQRSSFLFVCLLCCHSVIALV